MKLCENFLLHIHSVMLVACGHAMSYSLSTTTNCCFALSDSDSKAQI